MGYDLGFYYYNNIINKFFIIKRWILYRLIIGLLNIILFNGANIFNVFLNLDKRLVIACKCKNWEKILEYIYT